MKKKLAGGMLIVGMTMVLFTAGCQNQSSKSLENEKAYRQIGINKMEEGDYEGAIEAFQTALDESMAMVRPLEIDISYYKAMAEYKSGDAKAALKTYTALIEYDKKNGDAYYLRGCLYLEKDKPEKAEQDFNKAVELDDSNYDLYIGIYENYLSVDMEEKGISYLEQALKISGTKESDYLGKGKAYFALEDYENAKQSLDKADPKDPDTILCLAGIYNAEGEKDKAKELYESYLNQNPDDTSVFNELGCIQMQEENYEEALFYFQTALGTEEPANEQELRRNEIAAYEYLGDFTQAAAKMEAYIADYPDDEEAQREYTFLKSRTMPNVQE